jgi:lactoylglutathione lyase
MKFCWSTITVKNLEESIKFYNEILGLNVNRRFNISPGVEIAFLGDGETKIELVCNEALKEVSFGENISLGFEVDSVGKMITLVKEKGIDIESGPFNPNPHITFFYILDPNGLKIQLVEAN